MAGGGARVPGVDPSRPCLVSKSVWERASSPPIRQRCGSSDVSPGERLSLQLSRQSSAIESWNLESGLPDESNFCHWVSHNRKDQELEQNASLPFNCASLVPIRANTCRFEKESRWREHFADTSKSPASTRARSRGNVGHFDRPIVRRSPGRVPSPRRLFT